jgi:hypothetical protein
MSPLLSTLMFNRQRIPLWTVFFGYLAGCGVTGLLLGLFLVITSPNPGSSAPDTLVLTVLAPLFLAMLTCVFAWPSFIVLRFILWVMRRTDWPSFAVAGVLNAAVMAVFMFGSADLRLFLEYPPNPIILPIGFVAGVAACVVERYAARRVVLKAITQ